MGKIAAFYLIFVNLFTFVAYGADKHKARKHQWRIPERTLLILAAVGGSIGALAGMYCFHHKTRQKKFRLGVPAILAAQLLAACLIWLAVR